MARTLAACAASLEAKAGAALSRHLVASTYAYAYYYYGRGEGGIQTS